MLLENITMADFKKGLKKTKTIIIPFGTIEEHGSRLPLSTDTIQVYEVVKKVAEKMPVFVAPPLHYGVLTSTKNHAGSISISANSLRMLTLNKGKRGEAVFVFRKQSCGDCEKNEIG